MGTDIIRLIFWVLMFGLWPLPWQHHVLSGRHIPTFGANSLIGEIFVFFAILRTAPTN